MQKVNDLPVIEFKTIQSWEDWLEKYHKEPGVWIKLFKKNSGAMGISYAEALDAALCYGWIDSLAKSFDDKAYIQKFSPRRAKKQLV